MADRWRTAYLGFLILVASCHREVPTRPELRADAGRGVRQRSAVLDEMIDREYYTCCVPRFDAE